MFLIENIQFSVEDSRNLIANQQSNQTVIPINRGASSFQSLIFDEQASNQINEADFYFINMAVQSYHYYQKKFLTNPTNAKIGKDNKVYRSLLNLLENEEVYAEPLLDLSSLSGKLDVSVGYLSKVINDAANKSFNELINDYRIKKVKKCMSDNNYDHYTVVGYGLEAGFNSKSTFYKAFQKRVGMSSGKYLERIKQNLDND